MRHLLFLAVLISALGCSTTKKVSKTEEILNSWIGSTKQKLILQWGPPTQTTSDGNNGEILVYAHRVYFIYFNKPIDYWEYRMMYVDVSGKIYHWLYRKNPNPPDRIDVRVLL